LILITRPLPKMRKKKVVVGAFGFSFFVLFCAFLCVDKQSRFFDFLPFYESEKIPTTEKLHVTRNRKKNKNTKKTFAKRKKEKKNDRPQKVLSTRERRTLLSNK